MIKKLLPSTLILASVMAVHIYAGTFGEADAMECKKPSRLENVVRELPDSIFGQVEMEDLLDDEVYLKLAHEGWSADEIVKIMNTAVADKKTARGKIGYGWYAKQWLPAYGRQPGGDSLYMFIDTLFTDNMRRSVARAVPEDLLNKVWPEIEYTPDDRLRGVRNHGYFRPVKPNPSCGRMHWAALHPTDPDRLYAVADGAGIFKTDNLGKHWECITDRIPNRADRSVSNGYAIPVDPDDWDHVFAFMSNSTVYETTDGGDSWRKIVGATHKGFKRGDCFRDKAGNLKFIGATRPSGGWASKLWISEDTCKTWNEVIVPDSLKDVKPQDRRRGLWFQYISFDPNDRDRIYLPTSRSILYFDDGAKSEIVNGRRVYNIKKMHFTVYDQDSVTVRKPSYQGDDPDNDAIFPCPAQSVGDLVVNPNNPNQMWFATGSQITNCSAVYRSSDRGKTWITLQDPSFGIGRGNVFGNEMASVWLGGFGVNFKNQNKLYGCSMSSGLSYDGGRTFSNFNWATALAAQHTDGKWYTVSASRHNADNHFIRSHRSGRVFRGSDGGMLVVDDDLRANAAGNGIWSQIGGDMGQMLFYHIAVNEFGDQVMCGNTQDIDGQTYRYGRWGHWRGYEGTESFINPYTGITYFSGGIGPQGWDGDYMALSSWRNASTHADVVSGSWFMTRSGVTSDRTLARCDDLGQRLTFLGTNVGETVSLCKLALCRDKKRTTLFVCTSSNTYKISTDGGQTFQNLLYNGQALRFSNSFPAADPNNSDILYIGISGSGKNPAKVVRYHVDTQTFEEVGTGLPAIPCSQLLFHEGSGDLYFHHTGSAGFYILECKPDGTYVDTWRYWTKGYPSGKSGNAVINYTTQEMVVCDYGRGVWVADLEHPSDRYFSNGFKLKEFSFKDGRRTIGIDTEWRIPMYYYYKWTVNGQEISDSPYQYLRKSLQPGDKVQLTLTLRESPDVSTVSEVFTVTQPGNPDDGEAATSLQTDDNVTPPLSVDNTVIKEPGRAIYSNGVGRVDLGYQDYFFNDFTVDMWLKPMGDGTIIGNTTRIGDTKGWSLYLEGGVLKFFYAPRHTYPKPNYEPAFVQSDIVQGGFLEFNRWHHVAVTCRRNGTICLYVNGIKVAEKARIIPEFTLNHAVPLSLFADAIERYALEAAADEIKIWDHALSEEDIRREMYSTNPDKVDGLVAYYPFNGGSLENDLEMFTRRHICSRVRAQVTHPMMTVPTCARYVCIGTMAGVDHIFTSHNDSIIGFSGHVAAQPDDVAEATTPDTRNYGIYAFDAAQWQNEQDNLDTDYFDYHPVGYLIHSFDGISDETVYNIDFYPVEGEFNPLKTYRAYISEPNAEQQSWEMVAEPVYMPETGSLRLAGMSLSDIADKKILLVTLKPSIELTVEGLGADGILNIYDEDKTTYGLSADIIDNLPEPANVYQIESDGILLPSGLYFADGHATGEMRLDLGKLGPLNSSVRTTLRSHDNPIATDSSGSYRPSMIPLNVEVRNRIAPRQAGTGVRMLNGLMKAGSAADFSDLRDTYDITMMGWVRIDSVKNISSGVTRLISLIDALGVTGIQLVNGKISCTWSGSGALTSTKLAIDQSDVNRWFHVAMVGSSTGIDVYLNGQKDVVYNRRPSVLAKGIGSLYLGKSSALEAWTAYDVFSGAFDQVAVWNRALTQEEIIRYMYQAVRFDDEKLLSYINMDYADENGMRRDAFSLGEITPVTNDYLHGTVTFDEPVAFPFDARAHADASDNGSQAILSLALPQGKEREATVTTFRGTPYCYLNHDYQEYSALNMEYYGLTYRTPLTDTNRPADGDTAVMTYRHRTILGDERLAVAMRRTGTLEHLAGFIEADSVAPGYALFKIPHKFLSEASEIMFFTAPPLPGDSLESRPAQIQLAFGHAIAGDSLVVLRDGENSIPVIADVIGMPRNYRAPVKIVVNENTYATADRDTIDFKATESQFNILVDRNKIDKFGINEITVNLQGANANELKMRFCLEPLVRLRLLNGDNSEVLGQDTTAVAANTFRATSPISTLQVEAELVEGFLDEDVKLEVLTGLNNALTIGNGSLLQDQPVSIGDLRHYYAADPDQGAFVEGWNLIGNPYLTNINLTKSQNVDFNPEHVTKFIYQTDPATGNYSVFDMTDYNSEQKIHPFQSYFVQTMADNAELTVTPVAKETEPSKRTMAYNATEKKSIDIELYKDNRFFDHVVINLDEDASETFVVNEDAPKLWNFSTDVPQIYAMSTDYSETAVATTPAVDIDLGISAPASLPLELRLGAITGIYPDYELTITDNVTGEKWKPSEAGEFFNFTARSASRSTGVRNDNRFTISFEHISTGADSEKRSHYDIFTDNGTCVITGLQGNAAINIYTPNGVNIIRTHCSDFSFSTSLREGFYLVVISENNKDYSAKIFVK